MQNCLYIFSLKPSMLRRDLSWPGHSPLRSRNLEKWIHANVTREQVKILGWGDEEEDSHAKAKSPDFFLLSLVIQGNDLNKKGTRVGWGRLSTRGDREMESGALKGALLFREEVAKLKRSSYAPKKTTVKNKRTRVFFRFALTREKQENYYTFALRDCKYLATVCCRLCFW